jgi:hypothetical protein
VFNRNFYNAYELFCILSPALVGGLVLLLCIINNELVKSFVYLAGGIISVLINILIMNSSKKEKPKNKKCDMMLFGVTPGTSTTYYSSPNPSSVFISYTLFYLLMPMIIINKQINYGLIIVLSIFLFADAYYKGAVADCFPISGSIIGAFVGAIISVILFGILYGSGYKNLLFFNEVQSNNVYCSKPSTQKFKCAMYKDGKLVANGIDSKTAD